MNVNKCALCVILFLILLCNGGDSKPLWAKETSGQTTVALELQTDRYVGYLTGDQVLIGRLDEHGEFHRNATISPARRNSPGGTGYDYKVMNLPRVKNEVVYEFRSSRLIKGKLDQQGRFVPEIGSTIIQLSDYRIGHDAPRIYNLPGVLVPAK